MNNDKLFKCSICSMLAGITLLISPGAFAQVSRMATLTGSGETVPLPGHIHGLARSENETGLTDPRRVLRHISINFKPSPEQRAELDKLLADQQDPSSPDYHRWLTPEQYGDRFGLSPDDFSKIASWLQTTGLQITSTAAARNWISFDGSVENVQRAFRLEIHDYQVAGVRHFANSSEPYVPSAIAPLVSAITGLNDFRPKPSGRRSRIAAKEKPNDTEADGTHILKPDDYATIYNLRPLYQAGYDGSGQNLVIAGASDITLDGIAAFRSASGLPAIKFQQLLVPGTPDPGFDADFEGEAELDLEWAGAIARNATLIYVYSVDPFDAALSVLSPANGKILAPVISFSYGMCELDAIAAQRQQLSDSTRQGNTEGITFIASSGDSGAAVCDSKDSLVASRGLAVGLPASVPEVTSVGGTQFNEGSGTFWNKTNTSTGASALSYIPEVAWNEQISEEGLWSSGGGLSSFYPKPAWQVGVPGVPSSSFRSVPDVALTAAGSHDGYFVVSVAQPGCASAADLCTAGGTSASAPSFAGMIAILNQYATAHGSLPSGGGQGNINPNLYKLSTTTPGVFHDIVTGNNIVPCATGSTGCTAGRYGYSAGPGYDPVTGLGSVDANALITQWNGKSASAPPTLTGIETSKVAPPATGCIAPASSTSFLTTDNLVYLFFDATVTTSDALNSDWLAPNGDVVAGGKWNPATTAGSYCFTGATLSINKLTSAQLGAWQARIYDNGTQVGSTGFTVSQASAVTPFLKGTSPDSVAAGSGAFTLTVLGTGFTSNAIVQWNGAALPTTFASATQLTASVSAALIASAGNKVIGVSEGTQLSNTTTFTVTSSVTNLTRVGVLAQVAAGGGWDTWVYVTNSSAALVNVSVSFHADDGTALVVPLTSTQQGKSQTQNTSVLSAAIPPNTTLTLDTMPGSGNSQGWAEVLSNGPITAFAVFRYGAQVGVSGLSTPWEGTVPLQTQLAASTVVVPFDNTNGFSTGIALGSLTGSAGNVTASFFDDSGNVLSSPQTIPLPANGHIAFVVGTKFPFTANGRGIMKVTGSGLMAIGLRASPYGTLTSVPIPVQ